MLAIIAILTLLQSPPSSGPGPLDAFRANYASIKVDVQYQYTFGPPGPEVLSRLSHSKQPEYDESAGRDRWLLARWGISKGEIDGQWSCDGSAEYFHYASPEWMFERACDHNGGKLPNPLVNIFGEMELVADQSTAVGRWGRFGPTDRLFEGNPDPKDPGMPMRPGPFRWGLGTPFPLEIGAAKATVKRRRSRRNGHPVEVEIYEYDRPAGSTIPSREEISYDPALGYLPRFVRGVGEQDGGNASIFEMYLIAARPCAAGGFVPTEWYDLSYCVRDFSKRYPRYDDDTVFDDADILYPVCFEYHMGHFRVTDFKDRTAPIAFEHLERVSGITTSDRQFIKFPPGTRSLTIPALKALLRAKSSHSPASSLPKLGVGPTLDTAELNQFADQSQGRWSWWHVGACVLVVAVLCATALVRRRISGRTLALLLLCCWTGGCTPRTQPPVVNLNAHFIPDHVLFDIRSPFPALKLVVQNTGNSQLQLRGADGGCSCRKINQSKLPALLPPGEKIALDVEFAAAPKMRLQGFSVTFDTDLGRFLAPVSLLTLPANQIDPSSFVVVLHEGHEKDWEFKLVHRAVFPGNEPKPLATLEVPPEFTATRVGSHTEPVSLAPEWRFEDTTYRIALRDQALGIRKSFFILRGARGEKLIEVPAEWQRVPFLFTAPDRVVLGAHPVRVFLRCPDERVELTQIIAKPAGIRVVVSSVRELLVMLDDRAPDVIDGQVEVGTTASGRPPLKFPVVRYAPAPRTAGR